ncbi:MAG: SET domain-containing protein [Saezia sp.]
MPNHKITYPASGKQINITENLLEVKHSSVHGKGLFALRAIPKGEKIIEYEGEHISWEEADDRHPHNPDDPYHTFYFQLESSFVIDGGVNGNESRWMNHSCDPNTEAYEEDDERVFIYAIKDIAAGEEVTYNYRLVLDEAYTPELEACYQCRCGSKNCRGTMLGLKEEDEEA